MKFNIKMKEVFKNFENHKSRTRYKASIDKNSDIYLPNPIA